MCDLFLCTAQTCGYWPASRWILGIKVSKFLRQDLLGDAREVLLKARGELRNEDLHKTMQWFLQRNPHVKFVLQMTKASMRGHVLCSDTFRHVNTLELESLQEDFDCLDGLQHFTGLRRIHVSGFIGCNVQRLLYSLQPIQGLQELHLAYLNFLGHTGAGDELHREELVNWNAWNALTSLRVEHVECADTTLKWLVQRCGKLQHLKISGRSSVLKSLSARDLQLLTLTDLCLPSNNLGSDGAQQVACWLSSLRHLKRLDLSRNSIAGEGARAVGFALQHCEALTYLNLAHNSMRNDGASALEVGLPCCTRLEHLNLHGNQIGSPELANGSVRKSARSSTMAALHLLDVVLQLPCLTTMLLKGNQFPSEEAFDSPSSSPWAVGWSAVEAADKLESAAGSRKRPCEDQRFSFSLCGLDLSNSHLGPRAAMELSQRLQWCSRLRQLDLSSNQVDGQGAQMLASALRHCPSLTHLDLSNNGMGDDAAVGMSVGLAQCTQLTLLSLAGNRIGAGRPEARVELLDALRACTSMQHLSLRRSRGMCCRLVLDGESESPTQLREAFSSMSDLQTLDVSGMGLGDAAARQLIRGLTGCRKLEKLYMDGNGLADDSLPLLCDLKAQLDCQRPAHRLQVTTGDIVGVKAATTRYIIQTMGSMPRLGCFC